MRDKTYSVDFCVVGGGLAGVCASVTAARQGLKVVLIQDRPVLGGNASSEVRLWALGATSHMGNNNRWAREGGVIDEIVVENLFRNPEGNPVIFDTVVLDIVVNEPNITLLLNTAVNAVEKHDDASIRLVRAFCSQNSTCYEIQAPLFCDASGDGIVGDLAGAVYRMGAESPEEFGEKFAPSVEYGGLLGHSLFFYSKDTQKPVKFVPPSYALKDITKIPRYRNFKKNEHGCMLWWIEYGGRLDTVHESEDIKWELWRIVQGVWNYIKNSGEFPGAETMTLEWVGMIPGKRESRRFEGDYCLIQQDIVEQRQHPDAVSYGGWAIDLHPADGIYSNKPGCDQWHSKGVYQIPYRCLYSRNIRNLFLAGRIISASHVACGSTRVMMTCAHSAQAVGMAAAMCCRQRLLPRDLKESGRVGQLQQALLGAGQYIPGLRLNDPKDLVQDANIKASSHFVLDGLPADGPWLQLTDAWAMLLPLESGQVPGFSVEVMTRQATDLACELRVSQRKGNFTPDHTVASLVFPLKPQPERAAKQSVRYQLMTDSAGSLELSAASEGGTDAHPQTVDIQFDVTLSEDQYAFLVFQRNPELYVRTSQTRLTGIKAVTSQANHRVATANVQAPTEDIGMDRMEFWIPQREPGGQNLAMTVSPPLKAFEPENVRNGVTRPVGGANAWVADISDAHPVLTLTWQSPKTIREIVLTFDTDMDNAMESVLMGHPHRIVPTCVRRYRILDALDRVVHECTDNHQTRNRISLDTPVTTDELRLELSSPDSHIPASLFEIRCYE